MAAIKPRLSVEDDQPEAAPSAAETLEAERTQGDSMSPEAPASEETVNAGKDHPHRPRNVTKAAQGWLHATFPGHENAALGGLCGLVVAILVFAIGFWQTLFVTICVLVGVAIGQYADGNPKVVRAVSKLFQDNRG